MISEPSKIKLLIPTEILLFTKIYDNKLEVSSVTLN